MCITAPVLGAISSAYVASRMGGYTSKHTMPAVIFAAFIAMLSALPVPYFDNFLIAAAFLWSLLFFGAFILPILTGVMLSTVSVANRP